MSVTLSGSAMRATVAAPHRLGQYPAADPVQLVGDHLRRPTSVAAQMLKPSDPRCPFPLAGQISEALYAGGRGDVAERLRMPIDLARFRTPQLSIDDLLLLETEIEGAANNAQQAFSLDHSPGALDTLLKRFERQLEVLQIAVFTLKQSRAQV